MSYLEGKGKYQDRAEHYFQLLNAETPEMSKYYTTASSAQPIDNIYLNIFRSIIGVYSALYTVGLRYFDHVNPHVASWERGLRTIRETQGFGRCWGRAQEALELLSNWRGFFDDIHKSSGEEACAESDIAAINTECNASQELLYKSVNALMDGILEILPAYVDWIPTAKCHANQGVLEFLQKRGNNYRAMGNPKFYAYDRVVKNLAEYNQVVTAENCKYIKGVGPKISKHIQNFLQSGPAVHVTAATRNELVGSQQSAVSIPLVGVNNEMNNRYAAIISGTSEECGFLSSSLSEDNENQNTTPERVVDQVLSADDQDQQVEPVVHVVQNNRDQVLSSDQQVPRAEPILQADIELVPLVQPIKIPFLAVKMPQVKLERNTTLANYLWQKSIDYYKNNSKGLAWSFRRAANSVCDTEYDIRYFVNKIGTLPKIAYIGEKMDDVIREFYQYYEKNTSTSELPESCPVIRMYGLKAVRQQFVMDALWNNGFKQAAMQVYSSTEYPTLKTHFQKLVGFKPKMLEIFYQSKGNAPVCKNWTNQKLATWLWQCGQKNPTCYKAARAVAEKKNYIAAKDLRTVKYIGEDIATWAEKDLFKIINLKRYREECAENTRKRRRLH